MIINSKKFFLIFIFLLLTTLLSISLINFTIDPENIYKKTIQFVKSEPNTRKVVEELKSKKKFMIVNQKIWNDREFTNYLLELSTNEECFLIGSSQIRLISVELEPKILNKTCNSLINLGLNGASIEDYLAIFNRIRLKKVKNKKIIIAIHPWTLNFNRDSRWTYNQNDFSEFINLILKQDKILKKNRTNKKNKNFLKITQNLINFEYFKASIREIIQKNKNLFIFKNEFEIEEEDFEKNIIFYDGSIIKNKNEKTNINLLNNVINYKIYKDSYYDTEVAEILKLSARELIKDNKVIFLLTPYHPEVWKLKNEPIYQAMIQTEKIIKTIASDMNIDLIGSFNPKKISCSEKEFHDFLHSSKLCLSKLEN